jgi:hypothetical protein
MAPQHSRLRIIFRRQAVGARVFATIKIAWTPPNTESKLRDVSACRGLLASLTQCES